MKDLNKDFQSFTSDAGESAGSSYVLQKIHAQLEQPSYSRIALKVGAAHIVGSLVTLMSCSQFGVRLFFDGHGLMHYFMKISPTFCMAFCGALYLGISFIFARNLLSQDEWVVLRSSRTLSILCLSLISLGSLALVSHEVTFQTGLIWLGGAYLGGQLASLKNLRFTRTPINS